MQIAIISDIHANAIALEAVLEHIKKRAIDNIIFLGDLVVNGPHPNEVLEIIKGVSPLVWIKGNTDNWFSEIGTDFIPKDKREERIFSLLEYANSRLNGNDIEFLLSKPESQQIKIDDISILCVHGSNHSNDEPLGIMTPIDELEKVTNEIIEDVLLCGHSHLPYYASLNGKKIINVGSVNLSMDGESAASYGVLDICQGVVCYTNYKVQYDIQKVVDDVLKYKFPYPDKYIKQLNNSN